MKIKIWVLSTTIPDDGEPCHPELFCSEEAALAGFKERMDEEWKTQAPEDDAANPLPMPDDPYEAHDAIAKWAGPEWGEYKLTVHDVEIALPQPTGGLWTVGREPGSSVDRHIYDARGHIVGKAVRGIGRTEPENEANARLMAAAPALKAAIGIEYGKVAKHRGIAIFRSVGGFHYRDEDGDDSQIFDTIEACKAELDALIHADRLANEPGYAESCDDTPSGRGNWQDEIDAQRDD